MTIAADRATAIGSVIVPARETRIASRGVARDAVKSPRLARAARENKVVRHSQGFRDHLLRVRKFASDLTVASATEVDDDGMKLKVFTPAILLTATLH